MDWLGWGLVGLDLVGERRPATMETQLGCTLQAPGSLSNFHSISWENMLPRLAYLFVGLLKTSSHKDFSLIKNLLVKVGIRPKQAHLFCLQTFVFPENIFKTEARQDLIIFIYFFHLEQ